MEEVGLSKFYENTREHRVPISQPMHRAPFSKFRIPTTLHHRLAEYVGMAAPKSMSLSVFLSKASPP
jgi:hypothetical protein